MKSCLPPVVDPNVRLLILGSLPGEASLRAARYYAHPKNQFWRLIGKLLREPIAELDYDRRLERLLEAGIGLWDMVATAERHGSLDMALRDIVANPVSALADRLPRLKAVGFNGATAGRLGRAALADSRLTLVDLPSSSPAYTRSFDRKAEEWERLRSFLD
ncbi:DNA-deoxyinosine glycosylase [Sphingomonas ginkgonis]|uniref:DNA-deoxyinosine glycosylase n=1 Tax=Sphingomonas ginkgonis TaxID=2315330 RepID=UPI001EF030DE|nr:DNA-deoxyinosine glycosylase [Sphingomonas ginkgonis]